MKTFDITFKGKLLPEHDRERVKAGFIDLFNIEDPSMVEEIFSGKTVVLRSNLDRKSAAEYFVKVNELGGVVELVASTANNRARDMFAPARQQGEKNRSEAQRQAGMHGDILLHEAGTVDRSWPVSAARLNRQKKAEMTGGQNAANDASNRPPVHHSPELVSTEEQFGREKVEVTPTAEALGSEAEREVEARLASLDRERAVRDQALTEARRRSQQVAARRAALIRKVEETAQSELERLEALGETARRQAEDRITRLEQLKGDASREAEQEIARLKESGLAASDQAREEIARLKQLELDTRRNTEKDIARLEELELQSKRNADSEAARLKDLEEQGNAAAKEEITALENNSREIRRKASEDIARLEQLIEETRRQAENDMDELEKLIDAAHSEAEEAAAHLQARRDEAARTAERELAALRDQRQQATSRSAKEIAELKALQRDAEREINEELARIQISFDVFHSIDTNRIHASDNF